MGLEQVIEGVKRQGQKEASAIVDAAKAEAKSLVDEARARAAKAKATRDEGLKTDVENLRRRELAAAELESKKRRLLAERETLQKVRAEVEARIQKLPAADRERHLKALYARANMPGGRVYVREEDRAIAERLGLPVAGTFKGLGGLLVESPDGATTEDLRYENLLDDAWGQSVNEIAALLLGTGQ
ncbi:MAG TPA: V-type ATP synthase subunit E family protein [Candidatus Thermoplasmatota archaeon]|nr:V-type ATP synthase subunit E family protein [Candidatus Thermoplasmatota archaeon]